MKTLRVGDRLEQIPAYPHHKNFVYRYYRFFEVKSLFDFLTIDGYGQVFWKLYHNWRTGAAVPKLLLVDPTTACNLSCIGCWAKDYDKNINLPFEKLDEICTEAVKLGILQIVYTGGEPMMRRNDLLKLAEKHRKLTFAMFTNATLIDEVFASEMARLGNLNAFVSIEGFSEQTDMRRGKGTFDRIVKAMDLLYKNKIGYGFSAVYHSKNFETITGDEFLNFMKSRGAWFGWLFNYMPIGKDADLSLCCNAEQRAYVKEKVQDYISRNNYLLIDFANSGHKSIGCIGAGNDYAHINANGDLEPCAFCHYSDTNVMNLTLAEALRSPFFRKFRQKKPFAYNFLRPCPMIDVPEAIVKLTSDGNVKSTHLANPESAQELASKTMKNASSWKIKADELWKTMPEDEKKRFGQLTRILHLGNRLKNKAGDKFVTDKND